MNLLVALHGKPGTGEDLDPLLEALALGDDWETVAPTRPERGAPLGVLVDVLDTTIEAGKADHTVVLAYSWGAYLALQHTLRGQRPPDALVLLNPYLVPESRISPIVNLLLAVPGLPGVLIGRSVEQRAEDYLRKTFAPDAPVDLEAHRARLADTDLWVGAVQATNEHNAKPLPDIHELPVPVLAITGAQDAVAPWSTHGVLLPEGPSLTVHPVPAAGHALPWTHHDAFVPTLRTWLHERTTA